MGEDSSEGDSKYAKSVTSSLVPAPQSKHEKLRINWEGTRVNYDLEASKHDLGILMLQVKGAGELPKPKNGAFYRSSYERGPDRLFGSLPIIPPI